MTIKTGRPVPGSNVRYPDVSIQRVWSYIYFIIAAIFFTAQVMWETNLKHVWDGHDLVFIGLFAAFMLIGYRANKFAGRVESKRIKRIS